MAKDVNGEEDVMPMTVALATTSSSLAGATGRSDDGLQVNVGGRLFDISAEGSVSTVLLRRELTSLLNVCSSSSLQIMDFSGRQAVRTDEDLMSAIREGRTPLQAKLTAAALHEIEQKKREAESKKDELLNYQWQVVIEQIAVLSAEVRSSTAEMQSFKEATNKLVRELGETEELQKAKLRQGIREECQARESSERDLAAKIEAMIGRINSERLARDVADSQLAARVEQVSSDIDVERSSRARAEEELQRLHEQLRHEFTLEVQNSLEHRTAHEKVVKRVGEIDSDLNTVTMDIKNRLAVMEGEAEKTRASLANLEKTLHVQARAAQDGLIRRADELDRARKEGTWGRGTDVQQLAKNWEVFQQSVETRLQKVKEEVSENRVAFNERSQALEHRCFKIEKDIADRQTDDSSKDQNMLERINTALACVDNVLMAQKAADVIVETSSSQIAELEEQLRASNEAIRERARNEHLRPVLEGLQHSLQMQESKITNLEREMANRLSQEEQHRDSLRLQVHDSVKKGFDKLSMKLQEFGGTDGRPRTSSPPATAFIPPPVVTPPPRSSNPVSPPPAESIDTSVMTTASAPPTLRGSSQPCDRASSSEEDGFRNMCARVVTAFEAKVDTPGRDPVMNLSWGMPVPSGASITTGAAQPARSVRIPAAGPLIVPQVSGGSSAGAPTVVQAATVPARVRSLSAQRVRTTSSQ